MNFKLLSVFLCFILISCDDNNKNHSTNIEELRSTILENQDKWKSSSLSDYSFTYQSSLSDCPTADELPAVDINVEDGLVASVFYSGTSEIADIDNATTIDDVFSHLFLLVESKSIQFTASKGSEELPSFNENLGYPISFYVDKSDKDCDAIYVRVSNLK